MIELKNFTQLDAQEIKLVYEWRNHEKISQFMKNKNFSFQEHLDFINKLKNDLSKKYFLVSQNSDFIGVIDFINITLKTCEFGLYSNPNLKGMGQILMNEIKKYAFEILKVKNLKACVFKENERALNLYLKNDFTITKKDENMFYVELSRGGG
ncbi:UDP-4-amino-4,6-dideoxy-N-acetyl-beta-L-altrosamine N-acetyltransferase [Campylobacter sp. US33a]|uniref:UDP-4-amino-4, 6-dideoxy-N-acetyl-beta-L-altrosamine N-acetyltransferase n=1 Tax=Campylobacter sp. CCS1377 TaxID=3158229 RepID=A0AAU7E917_9BACT|nr:UDP-4-amino-4,6-dideoxy-N-acetyl-beta-L-altrosamine N-acetyltransferase [Campylobacter sp. US33a]TEY02749.1 UDP-4-amino-4,6-dideoxy-N-acetyl-beta-L-altrosamine N-acetyltransferase [Campylobacter sp. US33a]